jgi:c-di-GMP-binding flagellar brake protein YcgR
LTLSRIYDIFSQRENAEFLLFMMERGALIEKKEEKRRFERIELHADLRYQVRGQCSEPSKAVSSNVSAGGLALKVDCFLPVSTVLNIELNLTPRVLNFIGQVVWCQPLAHSDRCRIGVEFIEVDSAQRVFLSNHIKLQSGKL